MKTVKITVKPETSFITPLQSDTIFGEFCWQYRYRYGKERLEELLGNYDENPFIIFSDGFPKGFFPIPKFPMKKNPLEDGDSEIYAALKKFKKVRFISEKLFKNFKSMDELFELFLNEWEKKSLENFLFSFWKTEDQVHVSIDRFLGTAREGALFETKEMFFDIEHLNIYARFDDEKIGENDIGEVLEIIGTFGFGAKKSWGKGKFKVEEVKEVSFCEPKDANYFVSLSTGLPKEKEIEDFYAEFITKYPKHGNDVCSGSIFKRPVLLTSSGSVFKFREKKESDGNAPISRAKTSRVTNIIKIHFQYLCFLH
ncbi:MAG: type III-A CRISPR-associated RAMP protein Csm4 [Desulfurobacteriaceae bacterium]